MKKNKFIKVYAWSWKRYFLGVNGAAFPVGTPKEEITLYVLRLEGSGNYDPNSLVGDIVSVKKHKVNWAKGYEPKSE